jgi:hypothetical protein
MHPFFRGINGIMGFHEGFESDNMGKTMGKTLGFDGILSSFDGIKLIKHCNNV